MLDVTLLKIAIGAAGGRAGIWGERCHPDRGPDMSGKIADGDWPVSLILVMWRFVFLLCHNGGETGGD